MTVVICPDDMEKCLDDSPFELTGATPTGGTYSGPGVSGNTFDPALAGEGTHLITYEYIDENGCEGACTFTITVNTLPEVNCPPLINHPIDGGLLTLTGAMPEGGAYTGQGVSGGMFDPTNAGTGEHIITYTYANDAGCMANCTFTITVSMETASTRIPNAFMPTEHGLEPNRVFKPVFKHGDITGSYTLTIYNRWGTKIFYTESPDEGWDGTENNRNAPQGGYIYKITYIDKNNVPQEHVGVVMLIR